MDSISKIWFSPRKILLHYAQKEQELGEEIKSSKCKAMREARSVAIMLLGIEKMQKREYFLQLVDRVIEQTPDIRTATHVVEMNNHLFYQNVEVVTLESHSIEDVDDFLKRTKFSIKKSYPEDTIILCHIDKNTTTKSWLDISRAVASVGKKNDVYLLGRTDPIYLKYQLAKVNPRFDFAVKFDAMEEAKKKHSDVVQFERSTKREDWVTEGNHKPF